MLFRTRSGEPKVLSAYCPHLGIHMGEGGRVMGETIRCPYHGWQYDGNSGECTVIPYCDRIPKAARVKAWPVVERNRMILVWHHAEDKPPSWEVPSVPHLDDPEWGEPRTFEIEIPVHMQDMAENNMDPVHFVYIHGHNKVPETEFSFSEDGSRLTAIGHNKLQTSDGGTINMELIRETWGLGLSSIESRGIPGAGFFMITSTAPIGPRATISRWLLFCTKNVADTMGEEWFSRITAGVMDDWRAWCNKIHLENPVFCEADVPLSEFRRWARQFYSETA